MRREARLEAIRKANDLLYDQTDKMKMLKSQRLYADVIHDRVGQVGWGVVTWIVLLVCMDH